MKPKDPAAPPDAMIACLLSPTVPAAPPTNGSTNEKRTDKKLKLTLEAGHSGSAVVLHCQGRIIFRSEARALSAIVAKRLVDAGAALTG